MLYETYSFSSKPNVDKENGRLNNVVIMSTEFNLNKNAEFTLQNQKEIVELGNNPENKVYCYLGHAKQGATSNDRLPFRLGYFENFRIDKTKVKADLVLSPTIESNPVLKARFPDGITPYIYTLAEHESSECGFSMCVGLYYNEDDSVTIKTLTSVDLVEEPALTIGLFSKEEPMTDKIIEEVHPTLNQAFDKFNELDTSLKSGADVQEILTALLEALATLQAAPTVEEAEEDATKEEGLEEIQEAKTEPTTEEAPTEELQEPIEEEKEQEEEAKEAITLDSLKSDIDSMKQDLADIKAAIMSFSKQAEESKEYSKKEEENVEPVVFHVMSPISSEIEEEKPREYHVKEYGRLRKEGKYSEAATYHAKYL